MNSLPHGKATERGLRAVLKLPYVFFMTERNPATYLRTALIDEQIAPVCSSRRRGLPSVTSYNDPRSPLLRNILDHRMHNLACEILKYSP
ncbi:hypothetical protein M404DRAFT_997790 [Pisolithus tinctorius Marx 270]|uniref:Uncharacterized protein n=1 Tax=Pisolithus tinctorius Marx 270 TaxID=870435 RepID=A0A0C3P3J4_PISTI|nr:hypothetical protein M404DRAFT_997790 [Pisolithus tinctorius Marx 270]